MGFDPKNKQIQETLKEGSKKAEQLKKDKSSQFSVIPPINSVKIENTKNYTFSLKPSVRKKLKEVASMRNYRSDSKFLSDLSENL